jgi:hypothetical protein
LSTLQRLASNILGLVTLGLAGKRRGRELRVRVTTGSGSQVVDEFLAGATVRMAAYIYNESDILTDADLVNIEIRGPDGEIVEDLHEIPITGLAMEKVSTGVYEYFYYTGSTKGWYTGKVSSIDGTGAEAKVVIKDFSFRVR